MSREKGRGEGKATYEREAEGAKRPNCRQTNSYAISCETPGAKLDCPWCISFCAIRVSRR
jgi:hypothetical protein